jgi:DNA polymerase III sliding clamp (beta) subunit (PCNA family)
MSCVYIYGENKQMIAVATDGYRLAEKKISFSDLNTPFLIPIKNKIINLL